jgi:hypothetical protein
LKENDAMALKVDPKDLPKAEDVEAAKPILARLEVAKAKLEKARAALAPGGGNERGDKGVRVAKKAVRRASRAIHRERKLAAIAAKRAPKAEATPA